MRLEETLRRELLEQLSYILHSYTSNNLEHGGKNRSIFLHASCFDTATTRREVLVMSKYDDSRIARTHVLIIRVLEVLG